MSLLCAQGSAAGPHPAAAGPQAFWDEGAGGQAGGEGAGGGEGEGGGAAGGGSAVALHPGGNGSSSGDGAGEAHRGGGVAGGSADPAEQVGMAQGRARPAAAVHTLARVVSVGGAHTQPACGRDKFNVPTSGCEWIARMS